jgi:hypothetical protein
MVIAKLLFRIAAEEDAGARGQTEMPFVHRNHAVIRISGEPAGAYFSKRHGKPTVPAQPNPPVEPGPDANFP